MGGDIKEIIPVGSFFMEYNFLKEKKIQFKKGTAI